MNRIAALVLLLVFLQSPPLVQAVPADSRENLDSILQDIFMLRTPEGKSEQELQRYPTAPRAGSFGNEFHDAYAIDPSKRPIPLNPAVPLSPKEQEIKRQYNQAQEKILKKQSREAEGYYNKQFRLGLGFDTYIGLPNYLRIGGRQSGSSVPAPYLYNAALTNVTPTSNTVEVFNNSYQFSAILHLMQYLELALGLGYQSDSFLLSINTPGDKKDYSIGTRTAQYAIKYQKDVLYCDVELGLTLPWVLSGKSKTILGLRASIGASLGLLGAASIGLARPSLPNEIGIFDPKPSYRIIQSFSPRTPAVSTKISFSVGTYFELYSVRLYIGYSLRLFPQQLYPDTTFHILQDFPSGAPLTYSSLGFPQINILHAINLRLHYFINPLEILGKRSAYHKFQKKQRPKGVSPMRQRIG